MTPEHGRAPRSTRGARETLLRLVGQSEYAPTGNPNRDNNRALMVHVVALLVDALRGDMHPLLAVRRAAHLLKVIESRLLDGRDR